MKKFMIVLLSVAVLFSFIACDNSNSNTPSDEPTTGISDAMVSDVATALNGLLASEATISDLIGTSDISASDDVVVSSDFTTITITKEVSAAIGDTVPATTVTLVLNGKEVKSATTSTSKTIALETYEYKVEGATSDASENLAALNVSVKGYIVGTVAVVLDGTGKVTSITPAAPSAVLVPETAAGVSGTIGNDVIDSAKLYDFTFNDSSAAISGMNTYSAYRTSEIESYQNEIKSFVAALVSSGSDFITKLGTVGQDGLTGSYSVSGAGSATITYANATDAAIKLAGSGTTYVYLPADGSITLTLAGAAGSTATTESFTADSYTLTGTFALYSDEGTTANSNFETMTVTGLAGKAAGTVKASSNNAVTAVETFAFTDQTAGTVSAQIGVGPTLTADGTNTVETVSVSYAATV